MDVQPIPTRYNGILFRSRREACHAVYFDALDITWFYEYEGYELPSGRYLPDFWLPDFELWVEVKPKPPTDHEFNLMRELVSQTDKFGVIHFGDFDCSGFCGPEGVGLRLWAGHGEYGPYVGNEPLYLWSEVLKGDLPFDAACQRAKRYQFW